MGKVLYVSLRLARRVNVSAVVSIYKHLTLYSLNYPRRGCRFLQPGPSGFVFLGGVFQSTAKRYALISAFPLSVCTEKGAHAVSFQLSILPDAWPSWLNHPGACPSRGTAVTLGLE
jgi:hypothetical protein